ncbi:MAG: type II secretion system protein GspG, partial [Candidatus Omnitrophica bacterium]|nr:type II secretion system protein GspG [Candidatus Omnitrophota bacterium]
TKERVKVIVEALDKFNAAGKGYPKKLSELVNKGYLKEIPKDGWDNDFIYNIQGIDGRPYELKSCGPDKREGGEKFDADIELNNKSSEDN